MNHLGCSSTIARPFIYGRSSQKVRVREKYEDATLLAFKMQVGAKNQGMQVTSRSRKTDFPPKPPEGTQPANTLILAQ